MGEGMNKYTCEQFDSSIEWDQMHWWRRGNEVRSNLSTPVLIEVNGYGCDHETCYETHDQVWVFSVGEQFFRKEATYNSHDGTTWKPGVVEVMPVLVERQEFQRV